MMSTVVKMSACFKECVDQFLDIIVREGFVKPTASFSQMIEVTNKAGFKNLSSFLLFLSSHNYLNHFYDYRYLNMS